MVASLAWQRPQIVQGQTSTSVPVFEGKEHRNATATVVVFADADTGPLAGAVSHYQRLHPTPEACNI